MGDRKLACLVLAAGMSRRMGSVNKLLLNFDGQSMIRAVIKQVIASGVDEVFVVIGHEHQLISHELADLRVNIIVNPSFSKGIGTSLSLGISKIESLGFQACMLCLGDLPALKKSHFDMMINAYHRNENALCFAAYYLGEQGHPVIVSFPLYDKLKQLQGDRGAKKVFAEKLTDLVRVDFDDRAGIEDIDHYQGYLDYMEHTKDANKRESKPMPKPQKLVEGKDFYMNDQGFMVFTEHYHLKRGHCCESGCLHCPYGFKS